MGFASPFVVADYHAEYPSLMDGELVNAVMSRDSLLFPACNLPLAVVSCTRHSPRCRRVVVVLNLDLSLRQYGACVRQRELVDDTPSFLSRVVTIDVEAPTTVDLVAYRTYVFARSMSMVVVAHRRHRRR